MRSVLLLLALVAGWLRAGQPLEIRIVYDNTSVESGLAPDWGFAALITAGGRRILFDTGARGDVFMRNLSALKIDPAALEHVFISHRHGDHLGGLPLLRAANPGIAVHLPEREGPFEILPGIYSTGVLRTGPAPEQALVIDTDKGIVVITGCGHPGIVRIVEAAEKQRGANAVRLLAGGFHMLQYSQAELEAAIGELQRLKVEKIIPLHCTGAAAIKRFREVFGARFDCELSARVGEDLVLTK